MTYKKAKSESNILVSTSVSLGAVLVVISTLLLISGRISVEGYSELSNYGASILLQYLRLKANEAKQKNGRTNQAFGDKPFLPPERKT